MERGMQGQMETKKEKGKKVENKQLKRPEGMSVKQGWNLWGKSTKTVCQNGPIKALPRAQVQRSRKSTSLFSTLALKTFMDFPTFHTFLQNSVLVVSLTEKSCKLSCEINSLQKLEEHQLKPHECLFKLQIFLIDVPLPL